MPRYAALCCYFGHWPTHFAYWLTSCSFNREIDFWLVTDISVEGYDVPDNVHVVNWSFEECRSRVQGKFPEIRISLDKPYKLCDFKTAYGYIFDDLFDGYDYWGYYDIDTIWGHITDFIPNNEDCHLVKIFPCGHLSFIRNIAPWNKVYELVNRVEGTPCRNNMAGKSVVTWQTCFSSPDSFYYDEEGGLEPLFSVIMKGGEITQSELYAGGDFDNILPPWRFDHFLSINYPEKSHFLVYAFADGRLWRLYLKGFCLHRETISYVHFSKRNLAVPRGSSVIGQFSIFPNRIVAGVHWPLWKVLWFGRPRRVANVIRRIMHQFQ